VTFNLADLFESVVDQVADQTAMVSGSRRLSYAELDQRANRLAHYVERLGIGPGDRVGLQLVNGTEYIESMLACFKIRAVPVNVNYRYQAGELAYLYRNAGLMGLIFHGRFAPAVTDAFGAMPETRAVLEVSDPLGRPPGTGPGEGYEHALGSAPDNRGFPARRPDDIYCVYTGGTTGMPKGVLWRQHDIFMAAMGGRKVGTWDIVTSYQGITERLANSFPLKLLLLPPLMHGAAQWSAFMLMAQGATIVFPDDPRRINPDDVWRTVEREKANTMTIVGDAVLRPLVMQLDKADYDLSSFFAVGNGGAPLTPAVRELALARLPNLVISDSGGSSETGAQMHVVAGKDDTVGNFLPGPGTVVVDEAFTAVLAAGHEGIGWLAQTGNIPLGYLGDAEKTARTFPVIDGVRYSIPGDRARHLADGQIMLLGRDSVTVNSGGEKIFVEEVERAIAGHPAVADVVVTGRPSERWGQEVVAVVQLDDGAETTADSIVEHASGFIARYKLPKEVIFVPAIQRSPSGKADYRWAAAQAQAQAQAG
jgi:fatty-acyl-CoA synthase